jgi:hypothetical protein
MLLALATGGAGAGCNQIAGIRAIPAAAPDGGAADASPLPSSGIDARLALDAAAAGDAPASDGTTDGWSPASDGGRPPSICEDTPSPAPHLTYSAHWSGATEVIPTAAAYGQDGELVVVGRFRGEARFGPTFRLISAGGFDAFVVKFGPRGDQPLIPIWAMPLGGSGDDVAWGVAVDAQGSVLVAGSFSTSATFGAQTLESAGGKDGFLAKIRKDGTSVAWEHRFGGASDDEAVAVAVDAQGDLFATGLFSGSETFGGSEAHVTDPGDVDAFVLRLGQDGAHRWSGRIGSAVGADQGYSIATTPSGGVVVAGTFRDRLTWSFEAPGVPVNVTATGPDARVHSDAFVAELGGTGLLQGVWGFGGPKQDLGSAVAVDVDGAILLAGSFTERAPGGLEARGAMDGFVAKFGPDRKLAWARPFAGDAADEARAVAVDPAGDVLVTGKFHMSMQIGGATVTARGDDLFVAKLFGSCGKPAWAFATGGHGHGGLAAAVQPGRPPVAVASSRGNLVLGGREHPATRALGLLLLRF